MNTWLFLWSRWCFFHGQQHVVKVVKICPSLVLPAVEYGFPLFRILDISGMWQNTKCWEPFLGKWTSIGLILAIFLHYICKFSPISTKLHIYISFPHIRICSYFLHWLKYACSYFFFKLWFLVTVSFWTCLWFCRAVENWEDFSVKAHCVVLPVPVGCHPSCTIWVHSSEPTVHLCPFLSLLAAMNHSTLLITCSGRNTHIARCPFPPQGSQMA